jgi:pimeloyl-ACP methyl ester carboxylesterase
MKRTRSARIFVTLVASGAAALLSAQSAAPPQARKMASNGVDLTYVEQGKGEPIVFVHGAVADLRFWEPQRQAFASKYRFIAYTYRYHGTEPWPDDGKNYSGATHAADLTAFLTNLKAGPVHLVGLSFGGFLGAIVAAEHPELIRSLTLAEPGLFSLLTDPEDKPAIDAFNSGVQEVVGHLKAGDQTSALRTMIALVTGGGPDTLDKQPQPLRRMFEENARTLPLLFSGPLGTVTCDGHQPRSGAGRALRAVKAPTLVVEGARTPDWFKRIDKAVLSCIAGSRLVTIPDASHAMSADNPTAFNKAVMEFIAKR